MYKFNEILLGFIINMLFKNKNSQPDNSFYYASSRTISTLVTSQNILCYKTFGKCELPFSISKSNTKIIRLKKIQTTDLQLNKVFICENTAETQTYTSQTVFHRV